MKPYKFLISGGGTGGHIFPAIAIANELRQQYKDAKIEFVGSSDRMEMEKVPAAGYIIHGLWISGFQRKLSIKNLLFPLKVLSSLFKSYRILTKYKPDLVIGTGGFASGPLLKVATWLKIPCLIQEQNSFAGVTNKLLGNKVNAVCLGFEEAKKYFPEKKCEVTGNPVRSEILSLLDRNQAHEKLKLDPDKFTVLSIGGSLGARSINLAMDAAIVELSSKNVQVLWQTGKNYQVQNKPQCGFETPFIEDMQTAYSAADLIISRAGAIAISELCIVGKPVILVPSPNVAEDHQTKNAMSLVNRDAAILIRDNEITDRLLETIFRLKNSQEEHLHLTKNLKLLAKPNATRNIVGVINRILTERK
ncbi:MAG: undecaprenyldiphospho-muramoylpentapeptide beta-N-acetylglucosaminyltransferase [Flavobacteriales bacterium]|nr:undecaprenyldiphospho-muramoylpentapeptide beta-N-acetylglucosaminyltransferase [Flavobacteriales bacterium]